MEIVIRHSLMKLENEELLFAFITFVGTLLLEYVACDCIVVFGRS
jgi:hypothetical protein